jgi:putative transposase
MKRRHSAEQIVLLLREADVELGKGEKVPEVCRKLGITQQTYYRWRTKYGSMEPKLAKQLQELQKENARLKRLVAEQALDMRKRIFNYRLTGLVISGFLLESEHSEGTRTRVVAGAAGSAGGPRRSAARTGDSWAAH